MSTEELFAIVNPWYETGSLYDHLRPAVQQFYTELTGDIGERCRTCPNYWSDVLHELRVYLKSKGYQSMDNTSQQYMIRTDAAFLQVHGLPYVYINKGSGPESESAKYLTDPIAEKLLKDGPDRSEVIVKNPDYVAPAAKPKADSKPKEQAKSKANPKPKGGSDAPPATTDVTPPVEATPVVDQAETPEGEASTNSGEQEGTESQPTT